MQLVEIACRHHRAALNAFVWSSRNIPFPFLPVG